MSEAETNLWELLYEAMGFQRDSDAGVGRVIPSFTNLVSNPLVPDLTEWDVRSRGDEDWTTQAGEGRDGGFAQRIVRDTDGGGAESVYVQTNPGVASNGANAPDVSAYVGKWVVVAFEARARDVARQASISHVFSDASNTLISAPGGGHTIMPVSSDPGHTTRCWFAQQIPVGSVTDDVRFQVVGADEGEGFYFSQFLTYISDTEPLSAADLPPFFPTVSQEVDTTFPLRKLCEALCAPMQPVYDLVRERDGQKGWTVLLDPDECPAEFLPYLAQWTGVRPQPGWSEEHLRDEIKQPTSWKRGQPEAIRLTAQRTLTGSKLVIMRERTPEPGRLYIRTLLSETPDPARVKRDLEENVPAWILLDYEAIDGVTWADIEASKYESWGALEAAFASWGALEAALITEL